MDVETVSMPENEAEKLYDEYLEAVKTRKEKYVEDLKNVYRALKNGKKVIDIYKAFKDTGLRDDGNPKLAISQADKKTVNFRKEIGGAGFFSATASWQEHVVDVRLPANTFAEWKNAKGVIVTWASDITARDVSTRVPIIPAHLMPQGKLDNYYILWQVDEWTNMTSARDPFLLRRINANTFIVYAEWDLTPVEQIVMRGL
jgi:hypothetical protein